jgi:glucan endo-1,3-alpha-glucosidase
MAAAAGIDGFALNIGDDDYMWAHVSDAYAAAKAFGPSFKLFM